jgi:hypothetical protein
MANPANAAVRENRRNSTPQDLERLDVIKALTAAEYSRRQFVLNFAASRDTKLLIPGQKSDAVKAAEEWAAAWLSQNGHATANHEFIPGQKSDAVKAAEEWAAAWLSQNGHATANHEFFKYTVDARLWSTHGWFPPSP